MSSNDRNPAGPPGELPAPGEYEPVSGECAANVGPPTPDGTPNGQRTPPRSSAISERRPRGRRQPFVLRAAGATDSTVEAEAVPPGSRIVRLLQNLGPYLLIEILLPGGTLLALLLYASRNGRPFREDGPVERDGLEPLGMVPG